MPQIRAYKTPIYTTMKLGGFLLIIEVVWRDFL